MVHSLLLSVCWQLRSPESFVRGQACGCVGEVCIGNRQIKGMLSSLDVSLFLSRALSRVRALSRSLSRARSLSSLPPSLSFPSIPPILPPSSSCARRSPCHTLIVLRIHGHHTSQAIPDLIALLGEPDPATQRLAASALCNLSANHDDNKRLCREAGLVDALIKLLKSTSDDAVQVLCCCCASLCDHCLDWLFDNREHLALKYKPLPL